MERIHILKDTKTGQEFLLGAKPIMVTLEQLKRNTWQFYGSIDFTYDELGITQENVEASLFSGYIFIKYNDGQGTSVNQGFLADITGLDVYEGNEHCDGIFVVGPTVSGYNIEFEFNFSAKTVKFQYSYDD